MPNGTKKGVNLQVIKKENMDYLPKNPFMLVSSINMLLRDGEYESLEELCVCFDREIEEVKAELLKYDYVYSEEHKAFS